MSTSGSLLVSADVAAALYLPGGAPIRYVARRLFGALGPVAFVRNMLPVSIGERLERRDLRTMTLYDVLTQKLRVKIAEVRDEVEAVLAVRSVAKRLGINTGTAILSIRRVYVTAGRWTSRSRHGENRGRATHSIQLKGLRS